jgi:3-methyladenine DNA glycosylase AlkC
MENKNAFKNFINSSVISQIASEVKSEYPRFNNQEFEKIASELAPLELKQRVLRVTRELRAQLPDSYLVAIEILEKVMSKGKLKGFSLWPFSEFIGQFGLEHFDRSMQAMYVLTQHFTAEFAIRPFLLAEPSRVLVYFLKWTQDKNVHIRRWVSEGSRPLLPWGAKIPLFVKEPAHTLPLLEKLKFDEELYVRKSVANHLNDISKKNPSIVIEKIEVWEKSAPEKHQKKINWIKRQALRTLIKKGDKAALKLMGVSTQAKVCLEKLKINQKDYQLNDKLEFEFVLKSITNSKQKLVIDYKIHFVKANGTTSAKTFKLKTLEVDGLEKVVSKKSHSLRPITTMKYYPGKHQLSIQVNGKILASKDWNFRL